MPDDIPILTTDLTMLQGVLTTVHSQMMSHDLSEQYRKLDNRVRYAPLTRAVADVLVKVDAYLLDAQPEPEEDADA